MRKSLSLFSVACLVLVLLAAATHPVLAKSKKAKTHAHKAVPAVVLDPIMGLWYTQDKDGVVEFYTCGDEICGRFYWLEDDEKNGDISHDTHNPDPDKRGLPLCRMQFMGGFKPDGKEHYTDGWIYSPRHGANFGAEIKLISHDMMKLRGYMLFSFLGSTQTWTRAGRVPECKSE